MEGKDTDDLKNEFSQEVLFFYEPVEVLWFGYMEEVLCNGDDLILNSLFNFEPM